MRRDPHCSLKDADYCFCDCSNRLIKTSVTGGGGGGGGTHTFKNNDPPKHLGVADHRSMLAVLLMSITTYTAANFPTLLHSRSTCIKRCRW